MEIPHGCQHTAVLKSLASNDGWSGLKEDAVDLARVFFPAGLLLVSETVIGRSNAVYTQSQRALAAFLK